MRRALILSVLLLAAAPCLAQLSSFQREEKHYRWFGQILNASNFDVGTCSPRNGSVVECASEWIGMINVRGAQGPNPTPWYVTAQSQVTMGACFGCEVTFDVADKNDVSAGQYKIRTLHIAQGAGSTQPAVLVTEEWLALILVGVGVTVFGLGFIGGQQR